MSSEFVSGVELQKFYEKYEVKHPTAYIHKGAGLSVLAERSIPAMALVMQQTEKDEEGYYWADARYFQYAVGQGGNNRTYAAVVAAIDELYEADLPLNIFHADRTFERRRRRLIYDVVIRERADGQVTKIGFQPHPEFERKCLNPNVYAMYSVVMLMLLRQNKYALPYFLICSDIWGRASKAERDARCARARFPYEEVRRDYFGVGDKYPQYKDFNRYVLNVGRNEVNQKSDILGDHKGVRLAGRKIDHIEFEVKPQHWQLPMFEWMYLHDMAAVIKGQFGGDLPKSLHRLPSPKIGNEGELTALQSLIDRAVGYGTSRRLVTAFADENGYLGLEEVLTAFEEYSAKADKTKTRKVKNPGATLATFLRDKTGLRSESERQSGAVENCIKQWLKMGREALKEKISVMSDEEWRAFQKQACDFQEANRGRDYTHTRMMSSDLDREFAWKDSSAAKGFFRFVAECHPDWEGVYPDPIVFAQKRGRPEVLIEALRERKASKL